MTRRAASAILLLAAALAAAPAGAAADFRHCGDYRVDRFLKPRADGDFGAFDISRTQTTCKTARRIAARYVRRPGSVLRATRIEGWTCRNRTVDAQVVWVTCKRSRSSFAQINFLDWVPSG